MPPVTDAPAPRYDLIELRRNRGFTIRASAADIGVDHTILSKLERGGSASPATLKQVADYYGCTVSELFPLDRGEES